MKKQSHTLTDQVIIYRKNMGMFSYLSWANNPQPFHNKEKRLFYKARNDR